MVTVPAAIPVRFPLGSIVAIPSSEVAHCPPRSPSELNSIFSLTQTDNAVEDIVPAFAAVPTKPERATVLELDPETKLRSPVVEPGASPAFNLI